MFLTVISAIVFIFTSFVLISVVLDCILGLTLDSKVYGPRIYMTSKTLVIFLFWIASGAYLFQ